MESQPQIEKPHLIILPTSRVLLGKTWHFFKTNWKIFIKLLLLQFVPAIFFGILMEVVGLFSAIKDAGAPDGLLVLMNSLSVLLLVLGGIVQAVVSLYVALAMMLAIQTPQESVYSLLKRAFPIFLGFVWVQILATVIISIASLLFFVPGVIMMIFYLFVGFVYAYEKISGYASLQRSMFLVKGFWLSVLQKLIIWVLIGLGVGLFSVIPMIGGLSFMVSTFIISPVMLIYLKFLYDEILKAKSMSPNAKETQSAVRIVLVSVLLLGIFALLMMLPAILGQSGA